jgi:hypothetical protein
MKTVHVKNSIYDGTVLAGLPVTYKWLRYRPVHAYSVENNEVTLINHKTWYDIKRFNTTRWLRRMFLHDTSHMLLYTSQDNMDCLKLNDFGRDWTQVEVLPDGKTLFKNMDHLMDEFKIVALENILAETMEGKNVTVDEIRSILLHNLGYIVHTPDWQRPSMWKERFDMLDAACEHWNEGGMDRIRAIVQKLKAHL